MLFLTLMMESSVAALSVLVDATVVAGSVKDGTYGRARLWASVGWGVSAPIAGFILSKFGIHTCFMIFAGIYASASIPTFFVPAGLLASRNQHLRKTSGAQASNDSGFVSRSSNKNSSTTTKLSTISSTTRLSPNGEININTNSNVVQLPASVTLADTTARNYNSRRSSQNSGQHVVNVDVDAGNRRTSAQHQTMIVVEIPVGTPPGHFNSLIIENATEIEAVKGSFESDKNEKNQISVTATAAGAPVSEEKKEQEERKGLRTLFSDVYVLTFMFIAFLMGIGNGFIGYLFLLLTDLGASGTLLGLCLAINCVGEVPFFYFSGAIIKRLGVTVSFNLAMVAYIIRLGAYALLPLYPTLWIALPIELLQGLTFGLAYSAGTVHCRRISPKYLRSTVQSIFFGLYTGIGAGIGGLAGGMIYNAYGGQMMYIVATILLTTGWAAANFTNLIQYLRKGVKGGLKRAKQVGHRMRESFYLMKTGGSSSSSRGTCTDLGGSSGRANESSLPEEGTHDATAIVPVLHERNNASPVV
ncbi:putative Major facilitator superfamily domain-containing protein 6-B [Nannochloris sp. 'desiccata']|nr:hypothetical protein KSW81_000184 [Chlorella desiccata (nom. nud.)]KAH7617749.1 putative Major facilitator superfamily domain-containing protein 6-B [Chlorella desiccata (nom. nud.)]KAH7620019.1 putative Major facilitator superfamily domain-containing protein 6-B [Chlorella desiccata (nom. nud.)]